MSTVEDSTNSNCVLTLSLSDQLDKNQIGSYPASATSAIELKGEGEEVVA